ncbi:MAG: hypothetical protein B7Z03_05990 [Hydrogenophilales bacterium 32-62-9]|nr:MAG: hypothetical protein B7Z03_05990 [Hydrogenophilales bacterium 32-62-9]
MVKQEDSESPTHGHLTELDGWTEAQAIAMAKQDGLELSDDHLAIIRYLRDCYADHGGTLNAHILAQGPIAQASHYAGLPMPPGTRDPSFGTTH